MLEQISTRPSSVNRVSQRHIYRAHWIVSPSFVLTDESVVLGDAKAIDDRTALFSPGGTTIILRPAAYFVFNPVKYGDVSGAAKVTAVTFWTLRADRAVTGLLLQEDQPLKATQLA